LEVDSVDELTTGSDVTSDAEAGSEVEPAGAESEVEDDEPDVGSCEPDVEPDEESDDEPDADDEDVAPDSDGSASATPAVFAIAAPTPSATANAPTRPMYIAVPIVVPPPSKPMQTTRAAAPMSHVVR